MRGCKSCGGSLTKVGTAPFDDKLCFVCYLAKQNNKHIEKIAELEEQLEKKSNALIALQKTAASDISKLKKELSDRESKWAQWNKKDKIELLEQIKDEIDNNSYDNYESECSVVDSYKIWYFVDVLIENLKKEIKQ